MKTLSKEQVLRLHNALLETFGGTAGVRDDGLLESALNAPFATFGGQYLYPSIQAKAAQLGFGFLFGAAEVEELIAQTDERFPIVLVHSFELRHVLHDDGAENSAGTHGGQRRQECIFRQGNVRVLIHQAMHRHRQRQGLSGTHNPPIRCHRT